MDSNKWNRGICKFYYNTEQTLEDIMGDILMRLSDIARIAKIAQEQVLVDRIEDLIDKYEKDENDMGLQG